MTHFQIFVYSENMINESVFQWGNMEMLAGDKSSNVTDIFNLRQGNGFWFLKNGSWSDWKDTFIFIL